MHLPIMSWKLFFRGKAVRNTYACAMRQYLTFKFVKCNSCSWKCFTMLIKSYRDEQYAQSSITNIAEYSEITVITYTHIIELE